MNLQFVYKEPLNQLVFLLCIIIIIYLFTKINNPEGIYIKSDLNNKKYFVQYNDDKYEAAYILSIIDEKINDLKDYFVKNIDKHNDQKIYIEQFCSRINKLTLHENSLESKYTSYTVNKGEEIALCLRSKNNSYGNLHDINLITYVTLHELSHIACPELDHTELFKKIFTFFIEIASNIGIYKNINYQIDPKEYCGMIINENLFESKIL